MSGESGGLPGSDQYQVRDQVQDAGREMFDPYKAHICGLFYCPVLTGLTGFGHIPDAGNAYSLPIRELFREIQDPE